MDYQYLDARILYRDTLDYSAPAIDIFNPNHQQIVPADLAFNYQDNRTIRQYQGGLYLQDQVRLDRLVAIGGARYDRYRMDTDSRTLYQGRRATPWPRLIRTTSRCASAPSTSWITVSHPM